MINYIFTIAFSLLMTSGYHDTPVAYFEIHLDKTPYEITVEMEPGHLYLMTPKKGERPRKALNNYFAENLTIEINGKVSKMVVQSMESLKNDHLKINGLLHVGKTGVPSNIKVQNTSFIHVVDDQVNSVMIYQKDKQVRGFKMDKNRIRIDVDL